MPFRRSVVWRWLALLAIVAVAGYGFVVTGAGALTCPASDTAYLDSVDHVDASPDLASALSNELPQRLCISSSGYSLWITDCHEAPRLSLMLHLEPSP